MTTTEIQRIEQLLARASELIVATGERSLRNEENLAKWEERSARWQEEFAKRSLRNEENLAKWEEESNQRYLKMEEQSAKWREESNQRIAIIESTLAETDKQIAKMTEQSIRTRQEVGNISARLGRLVEDIVAPDLPEILRQLVDCPPEADVILNTRVQRKHPGQPKPGQRDKIELDATAACGNYALINETKSTLRADHVRRLVDLLPQVRDYLPEYRDSQLIGCVASLSVPDDVLRFANRNGIIVLAMKKGLIQIINPDDFVICYY